MDYLTDRELIDYVLKHETDPIRVRLASVMERMPGCIIDSLEDAGMDSVTCLFENTYDPGQYIRHLENEIDFLNNELYETQEKLRALKTKTVLEMMKELGNTIQTLEVRVANAEEEAATAKSKLSMWSKLNADPGSKLL